MRRLYSKLSATSHSFLAVALMAAAALLYSGCDMAGEGANQNREIIFELGQGAKYGATEDAVLSQGPSGQLRVESPSGKGGVFLEVADARRGDLYFLPPLIPENGAFAIELIGRTPGAAEEPLARILHRKLADGRYRLAVDLSSLDANVVTIELRDAGETIYRKEGIPVDSDGPIHVGTTSEGPTSFHYEVITIDGEKVTIVEVDYENQQPTSLDSTSTGRALVWPAFGEAGPFASTHVAFIPEDGAPSEISISGIALEGAEELVIVEEDFE